jgi:hypothetical protein
MYWNTGSFVRAITCATVLSAIAQLGCSFETSAHSPNDKRRPVQGTDVVDQPRRDAEPDGATDAGMAVTEPPRMDAGDDAAAPPASAPDAMAVPDAAKDAGWDASADEDAGMDDPDECDDPPPCVCPHAFAASEEACVPALCAVDDCAPDEGCRYLEFGSARYYFCDVGRTWQQARDRC